MLTRATQVPKTVRSRNVAMCRSGAAAPPPRLVPFPFPRPTRPLRGNVLRLRPGRWRWGVIDETPNQENFVTVGFANTHAEALRLCLLALRITGQSKI